jgi:hypothetical protein
MLEGLPLVRSVAFHGGYLDWPSYQRLSFRDTRSHLLANQERSTLQPSHHFPPLITHAQTRAFDWRLYSQKEEGGTGQYAVSCFWFCYSTSDRPLPMSMYMSEGSLGRSVPLFPATRRTNHLDQQHTVRLIF